MRLLQAAVAGIVTYLLVFGFVWFDFPRFWEWCPEERFHLIIAWLGASTIAWLIIDGIAHQAVLNDGRGGE